MDYSEARNLITPFGHISIFHLSGESGWKAVSSDIPPHGVRTMTRTGIQGLSSYASDSFISKFCDEAGLIPSPQDGDLQLISADQLPSFDPECVGQLGIVWSERIVSVPDTQSPVRAPAPRTPRSILKAIDLDFTKPLRLPDGRQPTPAAFSWTMAIKVNQMTSRERVLMAAVKNCFASPGGYVTKIGPQYVDKAADTLRKLWGVYRRHLRVPQPLTLTMALFDPHHLAYYFRLVASPTSPGRNYSPSALATEVQLLRHLLKAFMTLATRTETRENCGILFSQMPHGLDADRDVLSWLEHDVTKAVSWKPTVGGRKKERDVCKLVSETEFENWVNDYQATVEVLMAKEEAHDLHRTPEMAEWIQDLCVGSLMGAGMPPQRGDMLCTMMVGTGEGRCAVPGCRIDNCPGNRVLTRDEYVEYTGNTPEPEQDQKTYYIICGHYKNHTADKAYYKGPTIHTPAVTGKHVNFILGQMVGWASDLLYGMGDDYDYEQTRTVASGDDSDEDEDAEEEDSGTAATRYLLVDYDRGSRPFRPSRDRFSKYVKRCTSPISQPPTSFRFLFARMAESKIERDEQLTETEAQETRLKMATAMLTSVEKWRDTYASPRTRMPLPGFRRARNVVYGSASSSSVPAS